MPKEERAIIQTDGRRGHSICTKLKGLLALYEFSLLLMGLGFPCQNQFRDEIVKKANIVSDSCDNYGGLRPPTTLVRRACVTGNHHRRRDSIQVGERPTRQKSRVAAAASYDPLHRSLPQTFDFSWFSTPAFGAVSSQRVDIECENDSSYW